MDDKRITTAQAKFGIDYSRVSHGGLQRVLQILELDFNTVLLFQILAIFNNILSPVFLA